MAHEDRTPSESDHETSGDTAAFQAFTDDDSRAAPTNDGRSFRLLTLGIAAVVMIVLVVLLLQL